MSLTVTFGNPRSDWLTQLGFARYNDCDILIAHNHPIGHNSSFHQLPREELLEMSKRVSSDIAYFKSQPKIYEGQYKDGLITSSLKKRIVSVCNETVLMDEKLLNIIQVCLGSPSKN